MNVPRWWTPAWRARAITVALVAACWPLWWLAGLCEDALGLDDLDLLGRVVLLFAALTLIEWALGRVTVIVSTSR